MNLFGLATLTLCYMAAMFHVLPWSVHSVSHMFYDLPCYVLTVCHLFHVLPCYVHLFNMQLVTKDTIPEATKTGNWERHL